MPHVSSRLSLKGRNIIFSIHQPRYSIYKLFDSIMLLSHGDVVFHGKAMESIDYFKSIGLDFDLLLPVNVSFRRPWQA